jgi:predicted nucleic-acid-binding Zn-ribbon protein
MAATAQDVLSLLLHGPASKCPVCGQQAWGVGDVPFTVASDPVGDNRMLVFRATCHHCGYTRLFEKDVPEMYTHTDR